MRGKYSNPCFAYAVMRSRSAFCSRSVFLVVKASVVNLIGKLAKQIKEIERRRKQ